MTDELSIDEQSLRAAFEQSEQELTRLQDALHSASDDLAALAAKRYEFVVLSDVCRSLEELDKLGAGDLFWSSAGRQRSTRREIVERVPQN